MVAFLYAFHEIQHVGGIDFVVEAVVFMTPIHYAHCVEFFPCVVGLYNGWFAPFKPAPCNIGCDYEAALIQTKRGSSLILGAADFPSCLFLNDSEASGEAL